MENNNPVINSSSIVNILTLRYDPNLKPNLPIKTSNDFKSNLNDFSISNPSLLFLLLLAGPMTVIPLFLYVRGVELLGLGPTGMIFYITPSLQFILGYFLYSEPFSTEKLISFILIWIAVFIYLKDLYENN